MGKVDINKALELRLKKGLTYDEIGQYMGVAGASVYSALQRFSNMLVERGELEVYRRRKAEIMESVELQLLSDLSDPEKRKKASINNLAYALNTVANHLKLEQGKPTANVAYADMTSSLEEIRKQRKQLEEVLESM